MAIVLKNNGAVPHINYGQQNFRLDSKIFDNDPEFNSKILAIESTLFDLRNAITKGGVSKDDLELKIMFAQTNTHILRDYITNKSFTFRLEEQTQTNRVLKILDANEAAYSTDIPF